MSVLSSLVAMVLEILAYVTLFHSSGNGIQRSIDMMIVRVIWILMCSLTREDAYQFISRICLLLDEQCGKMVCLHGGLVTQTMAG